MSNADLIKQTDDKYMEKLEFPDKKTKKSERKALKLTNKRIAEFSRARAEGQYSRAFDIADELIKDYGESDSAKRILSQTVYDTLEEQYKDAILRKYKQFYDIAYSRDYRVNYECSGYTGTLEEYARNKAIEELMSLYGKTRYGGYMHVIVMRVIRKYIDDKENLKQEISEKNRALKKRVEQQMEEECSEVMEKCQEDENYDVKAAMDRIYNAYIKDR